MITFSDQQLAVLMQAASNLPVEKRATFIECVGAYLQMHDFEDDDDDIEAAVNAALRGLVHESAA
jgi:hypothetical protein